MASVRPSVRPSQLPRGNPSDGRHPRKLPSPFSSSSLLLPWAEMGGGGGSSGPWRRRQRRRRRSPACCLPLSAPLYRVRRDSGAWRGGAECVRSLPAWIDLLAHGGASLLQYGGGGGMTATASSFRLNSPPPIVAPPPNLAVLWPSQVLLCLLLTSMCVLMYPLSPAHLLR